MIIRLFHPGMVIETAFLSPLDRRARPAIRPCVVMAVHLKGLLVHPILPRGASDEAHAVYTRNGRVACDLRNVIEAPETHAVVQGVTSAGSRYSRAEMSETDFNTVRKKSLSCAYGGTMKSERLRGAATSVASAGQKFGIRDLQQPSVTERGKTWARRMGRPGT